MLSASDFIEKAARTLEIPRMELPECCRDHTSHAMNAVKESADVHSAIDYDLPANGIPRLLGQLFGRWYAKWCTQQMVQDAQHSFAT